MAVRYLSMSSNEHFSHELRSGSLGILRSPLSGVRVDEVKVWAMDNNAFTGKYVGDEKYLYHLSRLEDHRERCLFVAIPDVVADAAATLARFQPIASQIRAMGWPVALVGQDGMESMEIPWGELDWVFIGGSTEWKMGQGAAELIAQAKARGKFVHVGRVNSTKRFRYFQGLGCDSADGSLLMYGARKYLPRVMSWVNNTPPVKLGRPRKVTPPSDN